MTPNLSAFLWVLRHCEGTAGPNGYRMHFGGQLFDSFADHPRIVVERGRYRSTAAGAYQILSRTWDWFISKNGPHDFSPDNQDLCARWLIAQRGAIGDVEAGRFDEAIRKCAKEWASLPGSPYGQPTRTLEYCRAKYLEHGGAFGVSGEGRLESAVEPAPQPGETPHGNVATNPVPELGTPVPTVGTPTEKPMGAFAAFLPAILQLIPQLGTIFGSGSPVSKRNIEAATVVTDMLVKETQSVNLQEAVEKMEASPALAKSVATAVVAHPYISALVEVGGGIGGAREASAAYIKSLEDDEPWRIVMKFLFSPLNWVTAAFLWFVQQFIPPLAKRVEILSGEAVISMVMLVLGVLAVVGAYYFGTYMQKKDQPQ